MELKLSKEAEEELKKLQEDLELKFPEGVKNVTASAHVVFKSIPVNWEKEKNGSKSNTFRKIDEDDIRFKLLRAFPRMTIFMQNSVTGEEFARKITDYTEWDGYGIISWKHKD